MAIINNQSYKVAFLKKLFGNPFFRNAIYAMLGVFVFIFLINVSLGLFTRHGESNPVPDFRGIPLDSVEMLAKQNDLHLEVIDSVFVPTFPRGTVFEQNPKASIPVKKNRKVFITMNSLAPKKMPVPNVVGYSLRQAKAELNARGFKIGAISYYPDIATNNVLGQEYKGSAINEGAMLEMGSEIDLRLGLDSPAEQTTVPNVIGLPYIIAKDMIIESSLNVGEVKYDNSVKTLGDSLSAKVYKQDPAFSNSQYVNMGNKVSIYLKTDGKKQTAK